MTDRQLKSYNWLVKNVDQTSVIDDTWFGYFFHSDTLYHLMILTGINNYKNILNNYEGYTLKELLEEYKRGLTITSRRV